DAKAVEPGDRKDRAQIGPELIQRLKRDFERELALGILGDDVACFSADVFADAGLAEGRVDTVAGGGAREDNVRNQHLELGREVCDVAVAVGRKGDYEIIRIELSGDIRELEGIVVPV